MATPNEANFQHRMNVTLTDHRWTPVPILMYHAVEDRPRAPRYKHFYVTSDEFDWKMRWLKRSGYTAISFQTLADALAGNAPLPAKPVLLTFDDGYANLYTNVYPRLRELDWPYTVFVVSERVGKKNDWVEPLGYQATPLLTWSQIRDMAAKSRADFQPHTATHPSLAELPPDALRGELEGSRDTLEQVLQKPMIVFCYPYGHYTDEVGLAAREVGFTMAARTDF